MPAWLAALPIERVSVLAPLYAATAVLVAVLLAPVLGVRGSTRVRLGLSAVGAGLGALAGWLLIWWTVDVQDVFGTPASTVIRGGATAAGAAVGLALANLVRTRWWRKAVAVVTIVAAVAAGGVLINRDVAYYPRLGDVFGDTGVRTLALLPQARDRSLQGWAPPPGMPTTGDVATVSIPGTVSRWHARAAWVYLPPAARVRNPPRLPVVVAFSGEPGGPSDVFLAGGLQQTLDALAAKHRGIAPIVVVPDQLGAYSRNPMCLDSKLGHVATYVTVDVRDWVLQHLPVSSDRREWTVAGFSEGATCAVQFGAGHPAQFGSFIAVSPELGPRNHSVSRTIRLGYHGSRKAYEADRPVAVMKRHHYAATAAFYAVGAQDQRYGAATPALAAASRAAGMHVHVQVLAGLGHNWNTGAAGLADGLTALAGWWRLP